MTDDGDRGTGAGAETPSTAHAIYSLADVAAALGGTAPPIDDYEPPHDEGGGLAASRGLLRRLLEKGEPGRWRRLAHATPAAISAVEALGRSAPHMRELTELVLRHLRASSVIGAPVVLPPLVLVGPPGVGKSWFIARLAAALGLPHRTYPFALTTLNDGLSGSHPGWRASAPGLIARTLLGEAFANPLITVDEIDKPPHRAHVGDPYRPFYMALEPACSRAFVDEHLGIALDASSISWVASANALDDLPGPIVDRLTVVAVPEMRPEERAAVILSIYREANARKRFFFDPEPSPSVVARLAATTPRRARLAVEDAMVRAAANGRGALSPEDVPTPVRSRARGAVH